MRNLLIVDDEPHIRHGLQAMIRREFADAYEIALAEDGEEALELHRERPADLVITDIRMPGMDGIALIQELHAGDPKPAVMILSGYDDFQYAKEAIKCEVKEYLLKPVVREDLYMAVRRITEALNRSEQATSRLRQSDRMLEELRSSRLNNILLNGQLQAVDVRELCESIGLGSFQGEYYVGLVALPEPDSQSVKQEMLLHRLLTLMEACAGVAEDGGPGSFVHTLDQDGRLVLITRTAGALECLDGRAAESGLGDFRMGVGGSASELAALRIHYLEAAKALKYGFLYPGARLIPYGSVERKERSYQLPLDRIRKIANMLGTNRLKEMKALLHEVLDVEVIGRYDISYLERLSAALNELVFDRVFQMYGEETIEILRMYKKVGSMYGCGSFHAYAHGVERLLEQLNDYVADMKSVHVDQKEMKQAIAYIEANYAKDISMTLVSNHVSLNYTYFSQSFKAFTGENFVTYLKRVRIARAKQLLETTDLKVAEVGERVGFGNAKHFTRAFREMEGIAPGEYRDMQSPFRK
ncbi:two-component system, response regulator YesN [Paenibacillus sp. UNC496MF]|uniref:response regulator n=1 Tax=Paenibacillus sp. UNC496MF TaxID=1502753 RepID=UPI0008E723E7|nr:response regulator [Paenibacillus sp. UNC496MF]SFJ53948.1 two-component system, response regulator YesN [Paenibacillus sp. UNC496MF]